MTGTFELFTDSDSSYRFRITAPDGTVMALSRSFPDKPAAVAGIAAVREYAGMGHVTEIKTPPDDALPGPLVAPAPRGSGVETKTTQQRGTPRIDPPGALPSPFRRAVPRRTRHGTEPPEDCRASDPGPRPTQTAPTRS
ncbi:YegP family protein [Arthrobacter bambusae]|uniref:YegP family protein n=1 Tax=Arthrobacter bambusae TaxID=1338426 RepID=UPI002785C94E|nr:DUF1508 domain-containing protein [Arthrobacter bambusae]MDQ0212630.1 uncharacterized protein YegP (UPF0339 family) [Arthrobacter bambusae]MDQ0237093.1 uncharacterized protein YegP (UPF0339 family) [Arthrobacter bambusae]